MTVLMSNSNTTEKISGKALFLDIYYAPGPTLDMLYISLFLFLSSTAEHYNFHVNAVLPSWI